MINKYKYYLFLIIPIILVYFANLNHELVYCDDHEIILVQPERIDQITDIKEEFFKGYIGTSYYRPIINISFIIDRWIESNKNYIFHLSNILFHIIGTILFFNLLLRFKINKEWALIIASIFAILPINVNAVSWIVGRNDMLYTIFALSSILLLMKSNKIQFLIFSAISTLLAFLSKETALMTPLINIFILFTYLKYKNDEKIIYISLVGIMYLVYFLFKSNADLGIDINYMGLDILMQNLPVIPEFIAKIFIPVDLMALSTYGIVNTSIGLVLILGGLFYIIKKKLYNDYSFLTGLVVFTVLVGPAMFVTVSNSNDWNEYLECRAYFPTIGILLSLALVLNRLNISKSIKYIVILISLIYSFISYNESKLYSDRFTFYESLIKDDNTKALFPFMLSRHYRSINNTEKEEENLLKAYEANKTYYKYPMNLGIFYFKNNYFSKAFEYFDIAYQIDKNNEELVLNYVNALLKTNKIKETIELIEDYQKSNNSLSNNLKFNYFTALIKDKKIDQALGLLSNSFLNSSRNNIFNELFYSGEDYFNLKEYENARKLLLKAIEIEDKYIEPYIVLLKLEIEENNLNLAKTYANVILEMGGRLPESIAQKLNF